MPANNQKRHPVPTQNPQANDDRIRKTISSGALAPHIGKTHRTTRWIFGRAAAGKLWRGSKLEVCRVRGSGGDELQAYVDSLPVEIQASLRDQQPGADLRKQVQEQREAIAEECRDGHRKNGVRFQNAPWTQDERAARHAEFSRLPTRTQEKAHVRFEAVRYFHSLFGVVDAEMERYEITAREIGKSVNAIRNWVGQCKCLDRADWLAALAAKHRGRQATAPITPEALDYIKGEYFTLTRPSLKPIYWRATRMAVERGWTVPSYVTVKRLIKAEPHWHHVLHREGRDEFARLFPAQQRDYSALKLAELWCADGRAADVFARWEDGAVSRPVVVAWIDVRTRVCVGFKVGRVESADLIRLAFKAALEQTRALPQAVLMDNGRGFASKLLTGGVPNRFRFQVRDEDIPGIFPLMGIDVTWALPYSGRSKPIESFWRTVAEMEKRFPGAYCGNKPDARPEDCDSSKAVPIAQYRALLEETLREYHDKPHRGDSMDGRSPRAVYEELLAHTTVRQPTQQQLQLCLLAAEAVKLDRASGCVRIMGNRYWTEKLAAVDRDAVYVARFDPEDATQPVSIYRGSEFICEAPLQQRTGFRDQQAAKDHLRAGRQFAKARRQQADASKGMHSAANWIAAPDVPDPLQAAVSKALLPTPKVVTPLRLERDYRMEKPEEPIISRDDFLDIILNHQSRQANER
jgi:transposase InsO family protein